jgi:hypothetical protein
MRKEKLQVLLDIGSVLLLEKLEMKRHLGPIAALVLSTCPSQQQWSGAWGGEIEYGQKKMPRRGGDRKNDPIDRTTYCQNDVA